MLSSQMTLSDDELLQCKLCDLRSNSLGRHIVAKHGMTTEEYKHKFPGSETNRLTQSQIDKMIATKRTKDSKNKTFLLGAEKRKQETTESGLLMLTCRICEFQSANSLISHITRKHNVSMSDYRTQYPDSVVQQLSPSQRKTISSVMKEKLNDPVEREAFLQWRSFPSEIKHWIKKGLDPREAQEKVVEFQRKQSLKGNNELTRVKRSEKNSGSSNPMSLESIANRENITLVEAHALTPCYGRTGDKHPMFGKKHTDEALRKIASANHLSNPDYRSIPERQLEELCLKIGTLQHNIQIKRWNVDIIFNEKKIIVEMFGDFWHMNPKKYSPNDCHGFCRKNETAQQVWDRDARKVKGLNELGYQVIVIWESDWRFDKETCLKRIKDAYDRTL